MNAFASVPAVPGDQQFPVADGEHVRLEDARPFPQAHPQAVSASIPGLGKIPGDLGFPKEWSDRISLELDVPEERKASTGSGCCGLEQVVRTDTASPSGNVTAPKRPLLAAVPGRHDPMYNGVNGGGEAAHQNGLPPLLPGPMAAIVERRVSKTEEQISTGIGELNACNKRMHDLEQRVTALERALKEDDDNFDQPDELRPQGRKKRRGKTRRDSGSSTDKSEKGFAAAESLAAREGVSVSSRSPLVDSQVYRSVLPVPSRIGSSTSSSPADRISKQLSFASDIPRRDFEKDVPRTSVSMYDFLVDSFVEADTTSLRFVMGGFLVTFMCWHWSLAFAFFDASLLQLYLRRRIWLDKFPAGAFYDIVLPEFLAGDIGPSQPLTLINCGIGSVLILAAALAHDTHKAFYKFRPPRDIPDILEFFLSLAWLLRASMLPCYISVGALGAIIGSQTPFQMMEHTITAIFLLSLDDLAYRCLLDADHREAYEKGHRSSARMHHTSLQQQGYLNVYFQARLAQWIVRILIVEEAAMLSLYFLYSRLFPDAEASRTLWAGLVGARVIGMEVCHMLTTQFQVHRSSRFYSSEPILRRFLTVGLHILIAVLLTVVVLPIFGFRETGAENDCALRCLSDMQERPDSCTALFPGWPNPHTSYVC